MTEKEAYVAFNLTDKVGPVKAARLKGEFGSLAAAWEAWPAKIARAGGEVDVEREFALAAKFGVEILTPVDAGYPKMLLESPGGPLALYVKGDAKALSKPSIAMVGTRRMTPYGADVAYKMARELASSGWAIVSGLALGIDAESHKGALAAEGATVGILGSGLDMFFPEENRSLAREIVQKGGAVASEFPFGRPPDQSTFPQRNHIVAALSKGVVAIECPPKSGTLITTAAAADLGRIVMAVPGRVDSRSSAGCLSLIREGATLVRNARDVEEALGELFPREANKPAKRSATLEEKPRSKFSLEEAMVMKLLDREGVPMDLIAVKSGLGAAKANAICMMLRLKGAVRFFPGNRVALPRED